MAHLRVRDDAIWASHIEGDEQLRAHILGIPAGQTISLEVDGVVGTWVKMKDGKNGRTTNGLRPTGRMREIWRQMQARRGDLIPVRRVPAHESSFYALRPLLSEWDTPEDDEAFCDLPLS